MKPILAVLAMLASFGVAQAAPVPPGYARDGKTCGGYPRVQIETLPGMCAGLVTGPPPGGLRPSRRVLRLPRTLLILPDGDLLVVDLGSWEPGHGSVWRLSPVVGAPPKLTRLLSGLDLPHTAALGPDGRVYVGEMSRIVRFDPQASAPSETVETVIAGLPSNKLHDNRHPLSSFIFDADGALLVNVGAPSDQCAADVAAGRCAEAEGERPAAAVWRFASLGQGRWSQTPTGGACGRRNVLALLRLPSGEILQAENSIDVADSAWPYDEINLLRPGGHYGWPYCVGAGEPAPAWKARVAGCVDGTYSPPALMLPPHSAPLSLVVYDGAMFPQLQGRLLVSLHGYRAAGSRIVAYAIDQAGVPKPSARAGYWIYDSKGAPRRRAFRSAPAADGIAVTPGWRAFAGHRPSGSPVGLAVAADGAIWVAEDRTGAILRFARDAP